MRGGQQSLFWLLLPLVLGIIAFQIVLLPLWCVALLIIIFVALLLYLGRVALLYPTFLAVGYLTAMLNGSTQTLERQTGATITVRMEGGNEGVILSERAGDKESWAKCSHKVLVWGYSDISYKTLLIEGDILPIDKGASRYNSSMWRKGFRANVKIDKILAESTLQKPPLSARLNEWALDRLSRLGLNAEGHALASAVSLARREELPRELVESYTKSGTGHLLALSGLHLGVVLLLISAITFFSPLMRGGHIVADIVSIIFVWLFALMAGMGESVMRAAWMFTLLGLCSLFARRYNSLSSLIATTFVILCLDPSALYDLGFVLSVVAVWAIIIVGAPLSRALRRGNLILDFVTSSITISTVATLAIAPLLAYSFGQFSILSPVATLPLLLTTTLIILASLLAIIVPLPLWRVVIEVSASLQNSLVRWFASHDWGVVTLQISDWELAASYLFLGVLFLLVSHALELFRRKRESHPLTSFPT